MDRIEIYTDGSSFIGKNRQFYESSSAVVIFLNDECIYKCGCYHKDGTNSLGELYAMLLGLSKVKEIIEENSFNDEPEVVVFADSDYVVKSLTSYIKGWAKQGLDRTWISYSTKKEVAYQSIFKYLYATFLDKKKAPFKIKFYHINSHIPKSGLQKARYSFMKRNEEDISLEEFTKHSQRNDIVDVLAEKIRDEKIYYFEEGDDRWVRKRNIITRDGMIVIRKRKTNKK